MKRAEIETLLPIVFQRAALEGSPLYALLEAMEALHAPSEAVLASVDAVFDPRRTPDRFVPLLARWLYLDRLLEDRGGPGGGPGTSATWDTLMTAGRGRLRELVAAAAYLAKWRGTAAGLRRFLEVATGAAPFVIDERVPGPGGRPVPFHVRVRAPGGTEPHRGLITRIIETEKPAYVTYELTFETADAPAAGAAGGPTPGAAGGT